MDNSPQSIGPQRVSFPVLLLKVLAGVFGGAVGSLVLLFIFVISSSVLSPFMSGEEMEFISPVFVFLLLVMVFLASTGGNILSSFFFTLTERDKYHRVATAIYQIFIVSVMIFLLMVPVYFIAANISSSSVIYAIALHFVITAQVSALVLEIVSNHKYSLLGVYTTTFSIIVSAAVMFLLYGVVQSATTLLFAALPVVWGIFGLVYSVVYMLYGWIVDAYDQDFLSIKAKFGDDYGQKVVTKIVHKAKDEVGSDFLRHND